MENFYILEIIGKNPKRFIKSLFKNKINMYDIRYEKNKAIVKISYNDYLSLIKIKTSYIINIVNIEGIRKIKWLYYKYKIFFIMGFLSIIFLIFLSNIIFKINYIDMDKDMIKLINEELVNNNVTIYSFKKSYKTLEEIKNNIKRKYVDKIEWIEIEEKGVVYNVKVILRVKDKQEDNINYRNVVAKKDGILINTNATSGQVVKNPGDYVKKGDIIISGIIKNQENIVNMVSAKGDVYAEVWYKITIKHPIIYEQEIKTDKKKVSYYIEILGKKIFYSNKKDYSLVKERVLFRSSIFKIIRKVDNKITKKAYRYNVDELLKKIENMAKLRIEKMLDDEEIILLQKTLKKEVKNDRMNVEVFFKVKENISTYESLTYP